MVCWGSCWKFVQHGLKKTKVQERGIGAGNTCGILDVSIIFNPNRLTMTAPTFQHRNRALANILILGFDHSTITFQWILCCQFSHELPHEYMQHSHHSHPIFIQCKEIQPANPHNWHNFLGHLAFGSKSLWFPLCGSNSNAAKKRWSPFYF